MSAGNELLIGGRLDLLREECRGVRARQFRRLVEQCDWSARQVLPSEHPTASITYLGYGAANLALAWRLTGQRQYLDEARRWISTAVSFPHWGKAHLPDHDLDAGWLSYGLALAYDWLRDDLPADEAVRLRDKLVLQSERLHQFAQETIGQWWASSYWQNHNWICFTGLGAAGYALRSEHAAGQSWVDAARANFDQVLPRLPADGSDCEGVVYWRYGVPWLAAFCDLVASADGDDLFANCDFLRNTFWYRFYQAAPGWEEIIDHGDCHDRRSGHSAALYYRLAAEYGIPQAQWFADHVTDRILWREAYESGVKPGIMAEAFLEFLWYDPNVPSRGPDELPLQRFFPDLGLAVARTSWADDATMLSFKASPGGGHGAWEESHRLRDERGWDTLNAGHHHPDAGAFVLVSHGRHLAVDDGYANAKRAENHNLVIVDGQGFANEDRYHVYRDLAYEHQARITGHALGHGVALAAADTTAMYKDSLGLRTVERTIVLTPSGAVVVHDRLRADQPRTWQWLLHTDHQAEAIPGSPRRALVVRSGPARMTVYPLLPSDAGQEQTVTEVVANPTSSTPSLTLTRKLATLRLVAAHRTAAEFLVVLQPDSDLDPARGSVTPIHAARGSGVHIEHAGRTETVLFGDDIGFIEAGDLAAEAKTVVLISPSPSQPSAQSVVGVLGCRRLTRAGVQILDGQQPADVVLLRGW